MKKLLLSTLLLSVLAVGNIANAQGKIAVVDVPAVVAKSAQVKALKTEQQAKLKDLEKWLKTAQADVEKQKTDAGKEKLLKKYTTDFEKKKADIAQNYQIKLQEIDKSISATIAAQAKMNGYDVVIAKGVILYGGDDITEEIQKVVK